jgi:transcriptional regulator with GAF, ATPase, and Fis domain
MMERDLSRAENALIDTALSLNASLDVGEICAAVLDAVERSFAARSSWVLVLDPDSGELVTADFRGPGADAYRDVRLPTDRGIVGLAFSRREIVFVADVQEETRWFNPERVQKSGLQSAAIIPILYDAAPVGVLGLDSPRFTDGQPPAAAELARLRAIAAQTAVAIRNARLLESIERDRGRLRRLLQERRQLRQQVGHLREAVRDASAFTAVVGESRVWKEVLEQVNLVAPADSTVLLVGETGTGKELMARAIHEQSRRRRHAFVAVNCAAFPESLVESELFGHERGAFTGAFERKPGKFELADRGTLFLDEVGDLPAPVQAKLLRALQEREVHRVGGTKAVPINVRLIAATNRDLQGALTTGEFRQDLFYRLSVFPVTLPPLRERSDDVPMLAKYFVKRCAERQGREAPLLTPAALVHLQAYDWPGNVRELQNVLERAVILARDGDIAPDLLYLHEPQRTALRNVAHLPAVPPAVVEPGAATATVISFFEAERRAILKALETTGWRISGHGGAADLLGLKPTTLHAKMKRLGVRRPTAAAAAGDSNRAC